jgi:hypothetical protein
LGDSVGVAASVGLPVMLGSVSLFGVAAILTPTAFAIHGFGSVLGYLLVRLEVSGVKHLPPSADTLHITSESDCEPQHKLCTNCTASVSLLAPYRGLGACKCLCVRLESLRRLQSRLGWFLGFGYVAFTWA